MLVKTVFLALTLSAMGLAQEVDNGDIPRQCSAVCAPVVTLARDCDRQNNDNDRGERDCICNAQGASTQIPACEACVAEFDTDNDPDDNPRDNDVNDLLRSCNFSTTSYNPSATQQASASASGSGSAANNNSSARPTASGSNAPNSSPTGGSNNNAATGGSVQQSQNAAPAPTMMAGAGVLAGVAGLAAFL